MRPPVEYGPVFHLDKFGNWNSQNVRRHWSWDKWRNDRREDL